MPLTLVEREHLLTGLFHLCTTGASLERMLADLCVDVLGIFEARAALIFGLERDSSIPLLAQFGLNASEEAPYQGQHLAQPSPLTRCINDGIFSLAAEYSGWPGIEKDHNVVFFPIHWRKTVIASLVVVVGRDLEISAQASLWATFETAVALLLVSSWQPAEKDSYAIPAGHPKFSHRQLHILQLVGMGMSNRQISKQLHLGLSTVGHELMAIFRGLEVSTRSDAVGRASLLGLLTPIEAPPSDPSAS